MTLTYGRHVPIPPITNNAGVERDHSRSRSTRPERSVENGRASGSGTAARATTGSGSEPNPAHSQRREIDASGVNPTGTLSTCARRFDPSRERLAHETTSAPSAFRGTQRPCAHDSHRPSGAGRTCTISHHPARQRSPTSRTRRRSGPSTSLRSSRSPGSSWSRTRSSRVVVSAGGPVRSSTHSPSRVPARLDAGSGRTPGGKDHECHPLIDRRSGCASRQPGRCRRYGTRRRRRAASARHGSGGRRHRSERPGRRVPDHPGLLGVTSPVS